jgi:tetratricopeptide (TPR) repeat protein
MSIPLADIQELIRQRDSKKAEGAIAKLLRDDLTTEERAAILLLRARTRLLAARPGDAILDWQEAQKLDKAATLSPETQELLADCHLARFETAAVGFAQKADVREANGIYQRLVQTYLDYPNMGWLYYQQGRISLIEGQSYAAESYFHKALFSPSTVTALTAYCYERLGFIAYYESRQPKQALVFLNKAIDTDAASEPRLWLVQVYLLRSRVLRDTSLETAIESAQSAYDLADTLNKNLSAECLFSLAELLALDRGRHTEIIDCLQQFTQISKNPVGVDVTWSRVNEMLGDAYFATGQYELAIAAYQNALQFNPDHPWEETLHYRIAKAHYQQQQFAETLEVLKRIVSDNQHDYRVFNLLGNSLYALRFFGQAAQAYHTAIELAPPGVDTATMRTYYELSQQMNLPL